MEVENMTISEVSSKYNLTQDTIRYYERIGLIPKVPRTKSGIRNFDKDSCGWIEFVKCMRNAGLEIEVLIKYLELFREGNRTIDKRKDLLIEQRGKLIKKQTDIENTIKKLDYKIKMYDEIVIGKREENIL
jgi:DNA-binding transcriptional MerR regulator